MAMSRWSGREKKRPVRRGARRTEAIADKAAIQREIGKMHSLLRETQKQRKVVLTALRVFKGEPGSEASRQAFRMRGFISKIDDSIRTAQIAVGRLYEMSRKL